MVLVGLYKSSSLRMLGRGYLLPVVIPGRVNARVYNLPIHWYCEVVVAFAGW